MTIRVMSDSGQGLSFREMTLVNILGTPFSKLPTDSLAGRMAPFPVLLWCKMLHLLATTCWTLTCWRRGETHLKPCLRLLTKTSTRLTSWLRATMSRTMSTMQCETNPPRNEYGTRALGNMSQSKAVFGIPMVGRSLNRSCAGQHMAGFG